MATGDQSPTMKHLINLSVFAFNQQFGRRLYTAPSRRYSNPNAADHDKSVIQITKYIASNTGGEDLQNTPIGLVLPSYPRLP